MSFNLFCLFLILLQNRVTEQSTERTTDLTTDNTSNTETTPITEAITDSTNDESSSSSRYTETITSTESTTEGTTEDSNYSSTNSPTNPSTILTSQEVTEDLITYLTVSTKSLPLIQPRALPSDATNESEDQKSNEEGYKSYEKNFSTVSVFGIVLASLVGTIAVFYITVALIKQYRSKSYIVRTPTMELGQT